MKIFKVCLSIIILTLVGYGIYQGFFVSHLTKMSEITINGIEPKIKPQIEKLHGVKITDSFWNIDVEAIANKIKSHPWVEEVDIKKIFPNEIVIDITQRKAVALLNNGNGKFDYIDAQGNIFGPALKADEEVTEKVVISGKNLKEKTELRSPLIELIQSLPQKGAMSVEDISEIKYQSEKGYQFLLSKTGMIVDLGKENLPVRVDRARKVVQYLESHQINATHVDADYAKKVLVKVRKAR